jgi:hypothetical protein
MAGFGTWVKFIPSFLDAPFLLGIQRFLELECKTYLISVFPRRDGLQTGLHHMEHDVTKRSFCRNPNLSRVGVSYHDS